jgi:hypothetical protein
MSKLTIARHTAESIAWFWTVRQDRAHVKFTAFYYSPGIREEEEKGGASTSGQNSSTSPLLRLFAKCADCKSPEGSTGADTDWWLGYGSLKTNAGSGLNANARVACMYFTDGPCSMGMYGHLEQGRNDEAYFKDQANAAASFAEDWKAAGLDKEGRAQLQIFALPGAEGQGLDLVTQKVPQAKLDEWSTHFVK